MSKIDNQRVVITGIGINNCLGNSINEFWDSLVCLKNEIEKIKLFDSDKCHTFKAGQVENLDFENYLNPKEIRGVDRFALLALVASKCALEDSGIDLEKEDPLRASVILGSGIGGMMFYEDQIKSYYNSNEDPRAVHPSGVQKITPNALSGGLAIKFNCQGSNLTISTACSSSNHALGIAMNHIIEDKADFVISGGAEAPLMPVNFASFDNMRVMSRKNICRPFDLERDGFVMGEGAAILILEKLEHARKRDAHIYAEIDGYGSSCGAYHMVKAKSEGDDEARAMELALRDAKVNINEVSYISAHGTGTILNDLSEARAINKVFKKWAKELFVSSIKGATGHLIGACGATEAIASVLAIKNSVIPPNANYRKRDAECDLCIAESPIEKEIKVVLSNSFGFGNNNAVLVFRKFEG